MLKNVYYIAIIWSNHETEKAINLDFFINKLFEYVLTFDCCCIYSFFEKMFALVRFFLSKLHFTNYDNECILVICEQKLNSLLTNIDLFEVIN